MSRIRSDYYGVLGLANFAPMESVKDSHRALALKHHPDRGGDLKVMQSINEAYNFLKQNKEKYDLLLRQALQPRRVQVVNVKFWGAWSTASNTSDSTGGFSYSYEF